MRFGLYQAATMFALLGLLSAFNNCGGLDSPGGATTQNSQAPAPVPSPGPNPAPTLAQDFADKIGVAVGSLQTATADLNGVSAGTTISVTGFDAQVSLDGVAWTNAVIASAAATSLQIRMSADPGANVIRTAQVNAGGLLLDWSVSTHPAEQVFNTPGVATYTRLPIGRSVTVECWGGGGGAASGNGLGSSGGGGGGGGYSMRVLDRASIGATEAVTIGAGGNGGAAGGNNGMMGGPSSFGAHLSAGGGGGGLTAASVFLAQGTPGAGGTGITANGSAGSGVNGGKGGGAQGGAGGAGGGMAGSAPGGGGGATTGLGGGGTNGNGGAAAGAGGAGRCVVTVQP